MMDNDTQLLKSKIDELLTRKPQVIVAIDGCSGAGKSSLAKELSEYYDCNVLHMDDFFLRPEQRTAKRLLEPGGNVDYERFETEVIIPLLREEMFAYRAYDCKTGCFKDSVSIYPKKLTIIEGTYSLHPRYAKYMDMQVFLKIDESLQRARIKQRNPDKYERFIHEWIPLEQLYFDAYVQVSDYGMTILPSAGNVEKLHGKSRNKA